MYRERGLSAEFWAEPLNAITNAAFLIAALLAWNLAARRRVTTSLTYGLLLLVGTIGVGSFCFHTIPNSFTMWLDVGPIALFQVLFLWIATNRMLGLSATASSAIVVGVVGSSFALFPIYQPLNGSLFYLPSLLAMVTIGFAWSRRGASEPYLLVIAAGIFLIAITARSLDQQVVWRFGTHFLWHMLNGVVVYLAIRSWIVSVAQECETET